MKKDIHPDYNKSVTITCSCGHTFAAGSTRDEITTELCSNCHPFYSGKQKIIDTAGRIEKFKARMAQSGEIKKQRADAAEAAKTKPKTAEAAAIDAAEKGEAPTTEKKAAKKPAAKKKA